MKIDILATLKQMESVCPVDCSVCIKPSLKGLILQWLWSLGGETLKYSAELTIMEIHNNAEAFETAIHTARYNIDFLIDGKRQKHQNPELLINN